MAAAGDDDFEVEEVDSAIVQPFTVLPEEEIVIFNGSADDDSMASGPADSKIDFSQLPVYADANLIPNYQLHKSTVSSLKADPDYLIHLRDNGDGLIAAASSCRAIKIYDRSLCYLCSLEGHTQLITDICFVPTVSAALLSCSEDGQMLCFDARSNQIVSKFKGVGGKSLYCCASNGQLMVAGGEAGVNFWDIRSQQMLGSFEDLHTQDVLQVKFHPSSASRLYTGGEDGLVTELDLLQNDPDEAVQMIMNPEQSVGRIGFFGNENEFMYCISHINTLSLWNINEGDMIANFPTLRSDLNAIFNVPSSSASASAASSSLAALEIDAILDCKYDSSTQTLMMAATNHRGHLLFSQIAPEFGIRPVKAFNGAHSAVLRDIVWTPQSLLTCGEDARLCSWYTADAMPPAASSSTSASLAGLSLSLPKPSTSSSSSSHTSKNQKKFSPYARS